ncbi:MAG: hypothetical protein AAF789_14220, partial [Bacteroidota bacterium]
MTFLHAFRLTIATVFVFIVSTVSAQVSPVLFEVNAIDNGEYQEVRYLGTKEENVHISLFDSNGNIVYKGVERKTMTVDKLLNLTQLPHGTYTIELRGSGMKFREKIEIKPAPKSFDMAVSVADDKRVKIALLGEEVGQATVQVYDAARQMIYSAPMSLNEEKAQTF